MKVSSSVKVRCINCKIVRRKKKNGRRVEVICTNKRHRQRQG